MTTTRTRAGTAAELALAPEGVLPVRLAPERDGTPREALVLRDSGGALRAWLNRCRHLPIPLDGGSRRFLDDEKKHLMCGTHGALYRRHDGYCFEGPCRGRSLAPLEVEVDGSGTIWIVEPDPAPQGSAGDQSI